MGFMVAFEKLKGMCFLTEGLCNVSKPFGTETCLLMRCILLLYLRVNKNASEQFQSLFVYT